MTRLYIPQGKQGTIKNIVGHKEISKNFKEFILYRLCFWILAIFQVKFSSYLTDYSGLPSIISQ